MNSCIANFPTKLKEIIPLCDGVHKGKFYDGAVSVLENWSDQYLSPDRSIRSKQLGIDWYYLMYLEMAIQSLMNLEPQSYNSVAHIVGLEPMPYTFFNSLKQMYENLYSREDNRATA